MRTPVPITPDGETTSTLHYFWLELHHFAFRMTPIDTHFFIPIPSKTRFCKTLSNFSSKLATFQFLPAAKGLNDENWFSNAFFSIFALSNVIWSHFKHLKNVTIKRKPRYIFILSQKLFKSLNLIPKANEIASRNMLQQFCCCPCQCFLLCRKPTCFMNL